MDSELASETSLLPKSLLLGVNDVDPVFEQNADGRSPFLFTSDHYGRRLPEKLGDLGGQVQGDVPAGLLRLCRQAPDPAPRRWACTRRSKD